MSISKLGRYDVTRVLGKGAMGLVYEARDPNLDRRVAIKTIKVENLSPEASADYEARFRTEARSAARLQHPNIVSVYDSERHGDVAYLVMEFVQGDDLKQHLDTGRRYSLQESLGIVRDLLAALDYAHRQNIVHRDVKPANLLVEANGRVKLTDFGVARIQDSGEATRTKGSMVGTLKYMSPEQVQGLPVDARADLFAAGIVLYQLLTGKRPFDGESEFAIIHQIVSQHPAAPSTINPQLPPALDAVVARALSKQRDDRFATAHDFSLALQEASGQAPDPTIVPPPSQRDARTGSSTGTGALRSRAGGSTASFGTAGERSGSTVTQELELVYWKDVKDSDDPQDLQGFMDRFPDGIYADLARRRLKKFTDRARGEYTGTQSGTMALPAAVAPVPASDATMLLPGDATLVDSRSLPEAGLAAPALVLAGDEPGAPADAPVAYSGMSEDLPAPPSDTPLELTHTAAAQGDAPPEPAVPASESTHPVPVPVVPAQTPADSWPTQGDTTPAPSDSASESTHPVPEQVVSAPEPTDTWPAHDDTALEPTDSASGLTPPVPGRVDPMPESVRRGKGPIFAFAAVAVLAVAGVVFKMSSGGPSPVADTLPAPTASAPAVATASSAAEPASASVSNLPAVLATSSLPGPVASAPVAAALPKPAVRPASAATDKSLPKTLTSKSALPESPPAATTAATPATPAPSVNARPAPPKVATEPSAVAAQPGPAALAKACEGRVLLGFQSCMNEQCAKPAFANLTVCVERRAAASLNRNAQGTERN